jgi:hypothetical protein
MATKFHLYDQNGINKSLELVRQRRNKQVRGLFKLTIVTFAVILTLVVVTKIPGFYNSIVQPFPNIHNDLVNYNKMDLSFRTNILLVTQFKGKLTEISIATLDPTDKKVQILTISPKQKLEEDKAIENLYQNEKNDKLYFQKLTAKLMESLGMVIDGYLTVEQSTPWQTKESLNRVINEVYSFGFFINFFSTKGYLDSHLKTNLSIGELNNLINKVKSLSPDRLVFFDLVRSLDEQGYLDPGSISGNPNLNLADSLITKSDLTVEVVNASGVEGVGRVFENIFAGMGVNVIKVSSSGIQDRTEVIAREKTSLDKRLNNMFKEDIKFIYNKSIDVDEKIIIGEDLGKYFNY